MKTLQTIFTICTLTAAQWCFAAMPGATAQAPMVGMANPASVNCLKKGGSLQMRESAAGTLGLCVFKGGRQCEEWALFRGECPVGGVLAKVPGNAKRQTP